jgi:hypothetical protein
MSKILALTALLASTSLASAAENATFPANIATAQVTVSPGATAVLLVAARSTRKHLSIEYIGNSGGWLVIGNSSVTPSTGYPVFVSNGTHRAEADARHLAVLWRMVSYGNGIAARP